MVVGTSNDRRGGALSGLRRAFRRVVHALRRTRPPPLDQGVEVQADIGDRTAAIKFLADSQGPWKALLEQVENAIDEYPSDYPRRGHITVRIVGRGAKAYLVIQDHGRGFVPDERGVPDLAGVFTRVAKSFKGRLKDYKGAQGEFAVGLFGFRTIGQEMTIVTRTDYGGYPHLAQDFGLPRRGRSDTYTASIDADSLRAHIETADRQRRDAGTTITIRNLRNPRLWTGPKVKKAIEEELWGRLLERGLTVRVVDRRKAFDVVPKERAFEGALFPHTHVETEFGPVRLELYVTEKEDPKAAVSVLRAKEEEAGATRVYKSLTEVDELRRAPWNLRRLQGWVRFDAGRLAGPQRSHFLQDDRYHAFVAAMRSLEGQIVGMIEVQDAQREKAGMRRVLKALRGDLERVCRELPHLDIFRIARDRPDALYIAGPPAKQPAAQAPRARSQRATPSRTAPRRRRLYGLPPPEFINDGLAWRSRYRPDGHQVLINKGHPDYERESVTQRRWYRYLLKLYTKELVLQCYHGSEDEAKLLEATIEAQIRAEEDL